MPRTTVVGYDDFRHFRTIAERSGYTITAVARNYSAGYALVELSR